MVNLDKDRFNGLKQLIRSHNFWWRDERDSSRYEAGRANESYILKLCKETQEVSKEYSIAKLFKVCLPNHTQKDILFFLNHITKKF